jgi:hypothetical protein
MQLTDKMLQAAVRKAVEVELLPSAERTLDEVQESRRKVRAVLEVALAEADDGRYVMVPPPADRFPDCRFVVMHEIPSGFDALTGKLVYRERPMLGTDDRAVADESAENLARRSGQKAWVVDRIIE